MSKQRKRYDSDNPFALSEARADYVAQFGVEPADDQLELELGAFIASAQRGCIEAGRHAESVEATRGAAAVATAALLTVSEAAEFLRVSEHTIARLVASSQLKASKPGGGRVVIRRVDLERLLEG